eukprot:TRINITY_DN7536_c0_g1_i1.p1 TRINITY_DN7536_c0_g1~~TRINITY_DN7536_c0_g1_i1.p1  ORF type:complete len:285 (+),score=53.03 TRINITY_DN7536_c0_g1_i1:44-898(+)
MAELSLYLNVCKRLPHVLASQNLRGSFPLEFLRQLLSDSDDHERDDLFFDVAKDDTELATTFLRIDLNKGVLERPYYQTLSKAISAHVIQKKPTLRVAMVENLHNRTVAQVDVFANVAMHPDVMTTLSTLPIQEQDELLLTYIQGIGVEGVLILLGLQRTRKSLIHLPPSRARLLASFQQQHSPNELLSVGARALSKHNHRSSEGFWGVAKGSQQSQNANATAVLERLLDSAVWMNIHLLPRDVAVFEIRIEEGYGARWSADGVQFRGFLEPQIDQGWQVGWRH